MIKHALRVFSFEYVHWDQILWDMDIGCAIEFIMDVWWILPNLMNYRSPICDHKRLIELIMYIILLMRAFLVCM